jgi:ribosome-binding factor A
MSGRPLRRVILPPMPRGRRTERKDQQLCAQVREALDVAFASAEDPILEALVVVEVAPHPDAGHLLVTLEQSWGDAAPETVRDAVEAIRPDLRHEIANSIHRKRIPTLAFQLVPAGTWRSQLED